ncbi:hypothetical protein [Sphingomonas oryzagri]|uniref:Uncharacterized protein n=1 Tax=Sphingomonas oryzagri TaxID=3042314 RepID=A0ABT6N0X7_9SPHN|nr:hypothetical protein [Sphingomonas oryzagri]MDH7638954.1 hypothetical protein [Sphingomonas oryzagri]
MALTYHISARGTPGTLIYLTGADGVARGTVIPAMTLDDGTGTGSPLGSAANPLTVTSGSGASSNQVQGNVADGASDAGNSVKVGGLVNNTLGTTYTNGQRAPLPVDAKGAPYYVLKSNNGTSVATVQTPTNGSASTSGLYANSQNMVWNGTQWVFQAGDSVSVYSRTPPTTKTASAVTTGSATSQQLFAANTSRSKVLIQNQDASINVFVNVGAAAVAGAGNLRIAPGATLELNGTSEAINLIAASGTPAICAWQF